MEMPVALRNGWNERVREVEVKKRPEVNNTFAISVSILKYHTNIYTLALDAQTTHEPQV